MGNKKIKCEEGVYGLHMKGVMKGVVSIATTLG
jgi:hypothetical protein